MDLLQDAIAFSESVPAFAGEPANRPAGNKSCYICGRTYERVDHLNRHMRSHENQRAHKCTRCTKSFNRADLLSRHQASHDRPERAGHFIERGDRVAVACRGCMSAKAKCQDEKPCLRCRQKGISCDTSMPPNPQKKHRSGSAHSGHSQSISYSQPLYAAATTVEDDGAISIHTISNPAVDNYGSQHDMDRSVVELYDDSQMIQAHSVAPVVGFAENSEFDMDMGFVPRGSYFGQDIDFGLWDIDLSSVDMANQATDGISVSNEVHSSRPITATKTKDAAKRHAAFERSPWLWTPTQKDQVFNNHDNISVDEHNIPAVLVAASPEDNRREYVPNMEDKQRDQMVVILCTISKSSSYLPHLPSLTLFNGLMQLYFVQQKMKVDHFIHSATFNPGTTLPQLLLAIISAGSTLIAIPAIWKMGLALQDVVRQSTGQYWEENNAHTRKLQSIQAFMTMLDVGLWSGFKRNMEIAESFGQPVVIMLRRAGAFAATDNDPTSNPNHSDSDAVLDTKWRKWAERESWKRLILHLFMHDIQASIGLQKPPLIGFAELRIPLPASRALWLAKNAAEWRDAFLLSDPQPLPTYLQAMHEPETLAQFSLKIDVELTIMILVHGSWGQVWSLNESKKFFPVSKAIHRLSLHTTYTELYRDLSSFSSLIPSLMRNSTEAILICELLLLILHVGPEDLQRFAGKFGAEEARKSSEMFVEWAKSKESSIAVWHAGQVLRAAAGLETAHLRGFNAIALYYSSLTLWIYGITCSARTAVEIPTVILNETENAESKAFLAGNACGSPGLRFSSGEETEVVDLRHSDKILEFTIQMYKRNFPVSDEESLPPLIENLCCLLRDFRTFPSSRVSRLPSEAPHA